MASAAFAVTAQGQHLKAVIGNLNGNGNLSIANGAIRGINLGQMARNVKTAFLVKDATPRATDFSEMKANFTIHDGIVSNNDLIMLSPLLRIGGGGRGDLPRKQVNYRVTPKFVGSIKGEGGEWESTGIMVPVLVQGPFSELRYTPDIASAVSEIARDPSAVKATVDDAKQQYENTKGQLQDYASQYAKFARRILAINVVMNAACNADLGLIFRL